MREWVRWLISLLTRRRPDQAPPTDIRTAQHDQFLHEIERDHAEMNARLTLLERQARRHGRNAR